MDLPGAERPEVPAADGGSPGRVGARSRVLPVNARNMGKIDGERRRWRRRAVRHFVRLSFSRLARSEV